MKTIRGVCCIVLLTAAATHVSAQANSSNEATKALQRLSAKLETIREVSYDYYRDVNYRSENYRNELSGRTFLAFKSAKDTATFRFQVENGDYKNVFDGTTSFFIDKKEKTMRVNKQAKLGDFKSLSFFVNSIVTLRRSLPVLIADRELVKTVTDTTINKKVYQVVSLKFDSKTINNLGQLTSLTTKRDIIYKIVFDKTDYLPFEVIQTNSVTPEDYVLTAFSNYKLNADVPAESTWHYFNYIDVYKPIIKD